MVTVNKQFEGYLCVHKNNTNSVNLSELSGGSLDKDKDKGGGGGVRG